MEASSFDNFEEFRIKNGHSDNNSSGDWENIRRKKKMWVKSRVNLKGKCKILQAMHFFPDHNHYVTDVARSGMSEPIEAHLLSQAPRVSSAILGEFGHASSVATYRGNSHLNPILVSGDRYISEFLQKTGGHPCDNSLTETTCHRVQNVAATSCPCST